MKQEKLSIKSLLAILSAGLFSFCGVLIETATNITFPTLMNEFQVSTSTVQWMTTGNLLTMGIFIPISSFLKKRFPTKKLFLVAGFLFSLGLILDSITSNFIILLVGRLLQGAGVGIALPMMYNIILEESPKRLLGLMMGCGSFVTAAAPAIGPTFGGIMTQYLSWRFIFITVLPIILLATIMGYVCINNNSINLKERLDVLGFISIALAFILLILGFSNLDKIFEQTIMVVIYFVLGIFFIVYFGYRQINTTLPLINFNIFKNKSFLFHTLAIMFLQMTTLGFGLLLPSFVQIVLGQSATKAGVVLLPGAIIGAILAPIGGIILDKFGAKKPIMLGVSCCCLSVSCFFLLFANLTYSLCVGLYFIYSLGIGMIVGNTMTRALSGLNETVSADGNATIQTLMQLSGGIGTSISAAILAFVQQESNLVAGTRIGAFYVIVFLLINIVLVTIFQFCAFQRKGN